jgi:hypothetical protein
MTEFEVKQEAMELLKKDFCEIIWDKYCFAYCGDFQCNCGKTPNVLYIIEDRLPSYIERINKEKNNLA